MCDSIGLLIRIDCITAACENFRRFGTTSFDDESKLINSLGSIILEN